MLKSVAAISWSLCAGEVLDETHPHYAEALAMTRGENAEIVEEDRRETACAQPRENAAMRPGKRR